MAEDKQNSETEKINSAATDKSTNTGSAASTKQAKEETPKAGDDATKQSDSSANDIAGKAKKATENIAGQALGQVKDKAASVIDEQKINLASGINTVADSIRQIGENLRGDDEDNQIASLVGKYGDNLAGRVEKISSYVEDRELGEIVRDVEKFARHNPALFIGGAFALGILAARFLKSSGSNGASRNSSRKK